LKFLFFNLVEPFLAGINAIKLILSNLLQNLTSNGKIKKYR
jgi:hypothetical protein